MVEPFIFHLLSSVFHHEALSPLLVNRCYAQVRQRVQVQPKAKGHLEVQMDELWSFVD